MYDEMMSAALSEICYDMKRGKVGWDGAMLWLDNDGYIHATTKYPPLPFEYVELISKKTYTLEDLYYELDYECESDPDNDVNPRTILAFIGKRGDITFYRKYVDGMYCVYSIQTSIFSLNKNACKVLHYNDVIDNLPFKIVRLFCSGHFVTDYYACGFVDLDSLDDTYCAIYLKEGRRLKRIKYGYTYSFHMQPGKTYLIAEFDRDSGEIRRSITVNAKSPPYEELKNLGSIIPVVFTLANGSNYYVDLAKSEYKMLKYYMDEYRDARYIMSKIDGVSLNLIRKYYGLVFRRYSISCRRSVYYAGFVGQVYPNYAPKISKYIAPCNKSDGYYEIKTNNPKSKIVKSIDAKLYPKNK